MRKQAWRTFFQSWCPTLGFEPFGSVHNSFSQDLNKENGTSTACFSEYLARRESRPAVLHSLKGISNTIENQSMGFPTCKSRERPKASNYSLETIRNQDEFKTH